MNCTVAKCKMYSANGFQICVSDYSNERKIAQSFFKFESGYAILLIWNFDSEKTLIFTIFRPAQLKATYCVRIVRVRNVYISFTLNLHVAFRMLLVRHFQAVQIWTRSREKISRICHMCENLNLFAIYYFFYLYSLVIAVKEQVKLLISNEFNSWQAEKEVIAQWLPVPSCDACRPTGGACNLG